eukprot:TRINITY_DN12708_c1_g1_i1.p1 TRINITY_DN12708_c1_g1~~TRINITY_DN12708_c1_g1_i1.p1  ORF type:complete len:533 (+),score=73.82 TRINITY_DN12708_c1_g1_i1:55-1653(+)
MAAFHVGQPIEVAYAGGWYRATVKAVNAAAETLDADWGDGTYASGLRLHEARAFLPLRGAASPKTVPSPSASHSTAAPDGELALPASPRAASGLASLAAQPPLTLAESLFRSIGLRCGHVSAVNLPEQDIMAAFAADPTRATEVFRSSLHPLARWHNEVITRERWMAWIAGCGSSAITWMHRCLTSNVAPAPAVLADAAAPKVAAVAEALAMEVPAKQPPAAAAAQPLLSPPAAARSRFMSPTPAASAGKPTVGPSPTPQRKPEPRSLRPILRTRPSAGAEGATPVGTGGRSALRGPGILRTSSPYRPQAAWSAQSAAQTSPDGARRVPRALPVAVDVTGVTKRFKCDLNGRYVRAPKGVEDVEVKYLKETGGAVLYKSEHRWRMNDSPTPVGWVYSSSGLAGQWASDASAGDYTGAMGTPYPFVTVVREERGRPAARASSTASRPRSLSRHASPASLPRMSSPARLGSLAGSPLRPGAGCMRFTSARLPTPRKPATDAYYNIPSSFRRRPNSSTGRSCSFGIGDRFRVRGK